ncbi:MAG: methylmalonyl-CoA mutase small subunit [Bacteroidales bacterium]|nr:methylmalonyl-CoA mutase small subunit [Bacteroidales bacterium]
MAPRKLFDNFPPVTSREWEEKIIADLKGADYEKKLVWNTLEGFKVNPYYRTEHLSDKEYLEGFPGEYPFVRGNQTNSNDWEIRQDIKLDNLETANHKSLFVLDRGITSLGFISPPYKDTSLIKNQNSLSILLKDIYPECIRLYFVCGYNAPLVLKLLHQEVETKKLDPAKIQGATDFDPLGYLTILGNFSSSEKEDFTELARLISFAEEKLPSYKVLGINGVFFHNAGASIVQEMAFALSMAAEYLARMTDSGFTADTISRHMQFNLGVGSNYFMEIAKIRAFRYLWSKIADTFKVESNQARKADIHSITSEWNQTIYDPYVNVLRATTESMAAVIGGTDSLTVRPFTYNYKPTSKFSGRISRNIQIILKEEAYLSKIVDPSAGSYYIENLTDSLINESWNLFLKIEDEGGYLEALKKGIIQKEIETVADTRRKSVASRREILLGTNQYANSLESVKEEIDENLAFPEPVPGDTLVTPIRKFRGAMDFEKLRLATENHPFRPKVFLLTLGNLTMRKARASFSSNFFGCAGYEVIDNMGFDSPEQGAKAALQARADIVVVCSSDEEYAESVPAVKESLGEKVILVVAGAPACMEELKSKGIGNFIHLRSNLLETLNDIQNKLGIQGI